MSRNFELLRRVQKGSDPLEPMTIPVDAPAAAVRYEPRRIPNDVPGEMSDWLRAVNILKKHWRVSAGFAAAVVVLVTVVTLLMKPVYEPVARIQVDPPGSELFSLQNNNGMSNAAEYLETQAKNIQSDQLAISVIRDLHLDTNPEFLSDKPLLDTGTIATDAAGQRLTPAENNALRVLQKRMSVTRDTTSRLISVSIGAHDPVLAADMTNTLVRQSIQREYQMRHDAIMQSSEWLQHQLDDIRTRMEESNRTLADFQKQTGVAAVDETQNTFSAQMTELSKQLTQAQADRIQLQSYLNKFSGNADSLPQISSSPVVQALTQHLAEVRADLAQTLAIYGKNHPNAKRLQNQANELQAQLAAQRNAILQDLKTTYVAAQKREGLMQSQMKDTTKELGLIAQYNELRKEADANTQLYNQLFAKVKEAGIAAESKSSNIRIVDAARVLDEPARPKKLLNISLGLLAGILGGIVLAFVREGFDSTIRTAEDIKKCIGVGSVSIVPVIGAGDGVALGARGLRLLGGRRARQQYTPMFLLERPQSPEAEALRGLHTSVRLSRRGHPPQVLLIVSPFAGEGKTTLSCNLAIALAQHGRTCIVDCDLRKEGVAPMFGIVAQHGLSEVLAGNAQLDDVMLPLADVPNLTILPAGPTVADPGALIGSEAMSEVLRALRQNYEFIVIDAPPVVPFADGRALSPLTDGVVLVGRAGCTTREGLVRALELLQDVHSAPVVDIVLNAAEYPTVDYRYYTGYRYTAAA